MMNISNEPLQCHNIGYWTGDPLED